MTTCESDSSNSLKLVVKGYVPPSQNALRGVHWTVLYREKQRAAMALHKAILSVLESSIESMPCDPLIGTITPSSHYRTIFARANYYLTITGGSLKGKSSPVRHTKKARKERK